MAIQGLEKLDKLSDNIIKNAIHAIYETRREYETPLFKSSYKGTWVYPFIESVESVIKRYSSSQITFVSTSSFWDNMKYHIDNVEARKDSINFSFVMENIKYNDLLIKLFFGGVIESEFAEVKRRDNEMDGEKKEIIINGSYHLYINKSSQTIQSNVDIANKIIEIFTQKFAKELKI